MKSKIKIMKIITALNVGGAETLLLNICKGLVKEHKIFNLKIVTLLDAGDLRSEFKKHGLEVICLNTPKRGFFKKILKVYKIIRKFKPDIVHTHLPDSNRYGLIAAFLAGVKYRVSTEHGIGGVNNKIRIECGIEPQRPWKSKLTSFITSKLAYKIITVSHYAKKLYKDNGLYPEKKMSVIYNAPGFTTENILSKSLSEQKKCIKLLNIGKLHAHKGQIFLIRAMKELKKYPIKTELEIYYGVHSDKYKELLLNEVFKLNLDNVFFQGTTNDIKNILKNADILIASSIWESFHMVLVESMSMGVPVIATNIPPHKELLQGIENYPLFVEPANPKAIAEAVIFLLNSPKLYRELSEKCIEHAKKYSISIMLENYSKFYKSLVGKS